MRVSAPLAFLALALPAAGQTTWYVDASAPGPGSGTPANPYQSIQFAVDAATTVPGDTLEIAAGTYAESVTPRGKDLIFDGSLAVSMPIIDAGGSGSTLTIDSGETIACRFRGLVITGGTGTPNPAGNTRGGGALVVNSRVVFDSVVFRGNTAFEGGGITVISGGANFADCIIQDNQADAGGGLFAIAADIIFEGGLISHNQVDAQTMPGYGGGVYLATLTQAEFHRVTFSQNRTLYTGGGGAIYTTPPSLQTIVTQCLFEGNEPGSFQGGTGSGGAIFAQGSLDCSDSRFVNNGQITDESTSQGGAAKGGSYFNCDFIDNGAQQGGAIYGATATDCHFEKNRACAGSAGEGGAAHSSMLISCDIVGNFVCGRGGGVFGGTLVDCRVLDNVVSFGEGSSFGEGGGIHSAGAFNTLIERNRCPLQLSTTPASKGGGAYNSNLSGCSVLSNRASRGGGTYGGFATQCTISGNHGQTRSGPAEGGNFSSCVLWHNFPADAIATATFNYSNVESGLAPGIGNISANPLFFGGSAADVHLQAGSPSIDTAAPSLPPDPDGSPADMGSIPYDALWTTAPGPYCQSTINNGSCVVTLEAPAVASLGAGISLRATGGPPTSFGLFFFGTQPNYETVPGTSLTRPNSLCVSGTVTRTTPVQSTAGASPCDGEYHQLMTSSELIAAGVQVGDSIYGQLWFRQPPTPSGFVGTAMSNGVFLPIVP